ncbi:hypothetical protein ACHAW6_000952, partial [Cyclotella cf. meneghiniana]
SEHKLGFWAQCFAFTTADSKIWSQHLLAADNTNLSPAQKELLLWHHHLSHAGLTTIHNLLRVKKMPVVCFPLELVLCAMEICSHTSTIHLAPSLIASCVLHVRLLRLSAINLCFVLRVLGTLLWETASVVTTTSLLHEDALCLTLAIALPDMVLLVVRYDLQHSLNTTDVLRRKLLFEREAADVGIIIWGIHTDNGFSTTSSSVTIVLFDTKNWVSVELAPIIRMVLLSPSALSPT